MGGVQIVGRQPLSLILMCEQVPVCKTGFSISQIPVCKTGSIKKMNVGRLWLNVSHLLVKPHVSGGCHVAKDF